MWPLSEDRFRELLDQVPAAFYADSDEPRPRTLYLSSNADTVLGAGADEHLADPELWWRSIHPDDHDTLMDAWTEAHRERTPYVVDYRFVRPDGRTVWLRERAAPVRDAGGEVLHWQGVLLDVTGEREAIEELANTEERHRTLLERLPAFLYEVTDEEDPKNIEGTPDGAAILGYDPHGTGYRSMSWAADIVHPDDRERVVGAWRRARASGAPFDEEYRQIDSEGRDRWVHDHAVPIRDHDGRIIHWQGIVIEVTERVRAERAARHAEHMLATSEAQRRAIVENLPAIVYEMATDDQRRTLYISPRIQQLLGYSREEWIEQPDIWTELLHPDDRETELAAHDEAVAKAQPWSREYRLIAADGRTVWVLDRAALLPDDASGPASWQGVMLDITAQKEAEKLLQLAHDDLERRVRERTTELLEANELLGLEVGERRRAERELRGTEERYRHLIEQVPAVVYIWQVREAPEGTDLSYASPQIETLLGYTADEWNSGWSFWTERLHPHDTERVIPAARRAASTGEPFDMEYRLFARDGSVVWVLDRARLLTRTTEGDPLTFQGLMIDVTALREAEIRATEAERRAARLMDEGPVITYSYELVSWDPPEMRIEHVSPQMATVLGYPSTHWIDGPGVWFEMMHPDDRTRMAAEAQVIWSAGSEWNTHYRMITADGRVIWLNDRGRCWARDDAGRPRSFVGVIVDRTEEKERDESLRGSEERLRTLVESIPAITWIEAVDGLEGGNFLYISPQVTEMLGYTPDELIEERGRFERLVHPDDQARVLDRWERSTPSGLWDDTYRIVHRDGSIRWLHATGRRTSTGGTSPEIWQGVTVDVTDQHVTSIGDAATHDASIAGR